MEKEEELRRNKWKNVKKYSRPLIYDPYIIPRYTIRGRRLSVGDSMRMNTGLMAPWAIRGLGSLRVRGRKRPSQKCRFSNHGWLNFQGGINLYQGKYIAGRIDRVPS